MNVRRKRKIRRTLSRNKSVHQGARAIQRVPRGLSYRGIGMPNIFRTTVKYTEVRQQDVGVGSYIEYNYSCNGLFDPNITGAGHQPTYFDQMMAFYDHYTVTSSFIRIRPVNTGVVELSPCIYSIMVTDAVGKVATLFAGGAEEAVLESKECKSWNLTNAPWNTGQRGDMQISARFNAKQFFGPAYIEGATQYKGDSTHNPDEAAYYSLGFLSIAGNDPTTLPFAVEIFYDVTFSEPKNIGQS